jgi:hypothetical protein
MVTNKKFYPKQIFIDKNADRVRYNHIFKKLGIQAGGNNSFLNFSMRELSPARFVTEAPELPQ